MLQVQRSRLAHLQHMNAYETKSGHTELERSHSFRVRFGGDDEAPAAERAVSPPKRARANSPPTRMVSPVAEPNAPFGTDGRGRGTSPPAQQPRDSSMRGRTRSSAHQSLDPMTESMALRAAANRDRPRQPTPPRGRALEHRSRGALDGLAP